MARTITKAKSRKESAASFAGIPRRVMDHSDYLGLSGNAIRLLNWLQYQFKGQNNGDLTASFSYMKLRGFNSKTTLAKAIQELITANLIIQTRTGVFTNPGGRCALYALTWLPIDECKNKNLEVEPTLTPLRRFSTHSNERSCPEAGRDTVQKTGRLRLRNADGRFISVHK